jgi:hypothetical protein
MALAAGVFAALLVASFAFALSTNHAATAAGARPKHPIVRTVTKTVTVHRRAKAPAPVQVFSAPVSSPAPSFHHDDASGGHEAEFEPGDD